MLSISDFTREFPVVHKTDRDCEAPLVQEFIEARFQTEAGYRLVASILDIGAHYSGETYAPVLRHHATRYDGIDIQPADSATAAVLDTFYVGNANEFTFEL